VKPNEIIAMTVASIRLCKSAMLSLRRIKNLESKIENYSKVNAMDKKKILVVDDTDWNRDLLVQLLEDDYEILEAVDGEQGVRTTEQQKPDLILMDLGMPVMDGWEATRRIKANEELKAIPIIAVTSHAMVGDEIDARKAGCDDYLPKPIDEQLLLEKIKKFIG
jgi:two-component system cell cycle response regulator DivK